jgi:hypothetical protein
MLINIAERKRLFLGDVEFERDCDRWLPWAKDHGCSAIILYPVDELFTLERMGDHVTGRRRKLIDAAQHYGLEIEEGGFCLSRFVPRRLFMNNRDLFRMAEGKRVADVNFCPTNPETLDIIATQARRFFQRRSEHQVFHLWPDKGPDEGWCSCPTCRAFSPFEQSLIAINTLADSLAEINSSARLSYLVSDGAESTLRCRPNMFPLPYPQDGPVLERDGWTIAGPRLKSPDLPGPS